MQNVSRITQSVNSSRCVVKAICSSALEMLLNVAKHGYTWHEYFTCLYMQMDLLTTLETKTHCSFKGEMIFYSLGDK
jgi:uncharacterized protein (DUF427 family)|tara:strand:- start:6091 stop:6321 length:231 start_codon:yes stop_codon:yes gene_type:complete